jgi:hypothetical protein
MGVKRPGPPGLAVAGFVVGVCGLVFTLSVFCWFIGLPAAVVGTVLSAVGLRQASDRGAPRGLAITGLTCGIIALAIGVTVMLLVIFANLSTGIDEFDDGGGTNATPAIVAPILVRCTMAPGPERIRRLGRMCSKATSRLATGPTGPRA